MFSYILFIDNYKVSHSIWKEFKLMYFSDSSNCIHQMNSHNYGRTQFWVNTILGSLKNLLSLVHITVIFNSNIVVYTHHIFSSSFAFHTKQACIQATVTITCRPIMKTLNLLTDLLSCKILLRICINFCYNTL